MSDKDKSRSELLAEVRRLRSRTRLLEGAWHSSQAAEKPLREQEKTLRNLLECSPEAILITGEDGTITDCSRAAVQMYGFAKREELIGRNSFDFIAPGVEHDMVQEMVETLALDYGNAKEYVCLARGPREFPMEVSARAIPDEEGALSGYIVIARDISRRRAAEERLMLEKEYARTIVETSMDGIVIFNERGDVADFNVAALGLLGYTAEELRALSRRDLTPETYTEADETAMQQAEQSGLFEEYEKEYLRKDGSLLPALVSGGILGGKPEGPGWRAVAFIKDITERKRAETVLRFERDRLDEITHSVGAGLLVVARDRTAAWANTALIEMVGAVDGLKCHQVLCGRSDTCPDCPVEKIFEAGAEQVEHLIVARGTDGRPFDARVIATPLRDDDGNVTSSLQVVLPVRGEDEGQPATASGGIEGEILGRLAELDKIKGEFLEFLTHSRSGAADARRWLSIDEVAGYLGVKRDTVYKWIRYRNLPAHKIGRLWKFQREEVDAWLSGGQGRGL